MDTRKSMFAFMRDSITRDDQEKIYYYGNRIEASRLLRHIDAVAAYLTSLGIDRGDVVGICLPNIPQALIAFYAVNKIGAVANVIHPKTGAEALREIAARTETKLVFVFDRFLRPHLNERLKLVYCRVSDYLVGAKRIYRATEPSFKRTEYCTAWSTVIAEYLDRTATEYVGDGTDPAVYLHSSGTTGTPKTVVLSSYAFNELAVNCYDTVKHLCTVEDDIGLLMILPLFHGFGLGICVHLAMHKGRSILVPLFRARATVRLMKKEEVNVLTGVPGMFRRLYEQKGFDGAFLKNLKLIFCGGDRLSPDLKEKFQSRLKANGCDVPIMEGYGMSEVASVATINVFSPDNGSLGQGIKGTEIKIIADGEECETGKIGEIYLSAPTMMNGYLDGTAEFCVLDGKKWLATGDMGYLDADGCLYYKERIKRIVKIGGVNVFPSEIEETAVKFRGVKQACAVRISLKGKAAVKLLIVADGEVKQNELKDFIRAELTPYAVPRIIERVTEIKTTLIGKSDYKYYEEEVK